MCWTSSEFVCEVCNMLTDVKPNVLVLMLLFSSSTVHKDCLALIDLLTGICVSVFVFAGPVLYILT